MLGAHCVGSVPHLSTLPGDPQRGKQPRDRESDNALKLWSEEELRCRQDCVAPETLLFLTTMLYFWVEETDLAWMESNVIGLND